MRARLEGQVRDSEGAGTGGDCMAERDPRIGEGWELGEATEGEMGGMMGMGTEGDGGIHGKGTKREGITGSNEWGGRQSWGRGAEGRVVIMGKGRK
jgi:hypothetical protein